MSGKVYLVGAGPGDPELVTIKGMELIRKADCIVYDRLLSPELLGYTRADCECIYVGKEDRHHTLPQEEINELLVEKAKRYHCVVRLKGGDPYVFGRGAEEALYLREHGVSFVVVPGVSSSIAGAAYAGIPVTHRGLATGFRVITAHNRKDEMPDMDFTSMLDVNETLVFLMGLSKVEEIAKGLLSAGRKADTPVAVIAHATLMSQQVCVGTLCDIAQKVGERQLTSPAIIVVGDVVQLHTALQFFEQRPLWGRRYLVPKIGREPSRISLLLREKGAQVQECMVGRLVGIPAHYTAQELKQVDILLFTSKNGVDYFMRNLFSSGLDVRAVSHMKFAVIGQNTAKRLKTYGLSADLMPEHAHGEALAKELQEYIAHTFSGNPFRRIAVWYPTARNAKDQLVDTLLSFCDCGRLDVYENQPFVPGEKEPFGIPDPEEWRNFDGILFTCASSAGRLLGGVPAEQLASLLAQTTIYSIGPKCSLELTKLGVSPVVEAAVCSCEGLLNTLLHG